MDYSSFFLSAKIIFWCAILFMSFGVFVAYFLATSKSKFKFLVDSLITLPLIFPPVAIGFFCYYYLVKMEF
ncbi:ABC transporter permease [Campylobacter sputorum]|uniref:hypothetical protein n=1 Tax=Campylobacter sputorum TaxID=206 RepID=UPI000B774ABF|nr:MULTISPECIES: hypothetical protein [unclassified Campylobacter]